MIDFKPSAPVIEEYWPDYLRDYKELAAIAAAELEMLQTYLDAVEQVHRSMLVRYADSDGLRLYEEMLGVLVPDGATIEDRRVAIIAKLNTRLPYTKRVLRRFLDALVGEEGYTLEIRYDDRQLRTRIELTRRNQIDAVRDMLRKVLPANMVLDLDLLYNPLYMLEKFTLDELKGYTLEQLRSDPEIKRIFLERGGVMQ